MVKRAIVRMVFGVFASLALIQPHTTAFADTPAVTDFGQVEATPALTSHSGGFRQAVFLTLYPDGRSHSEVRGVKDDAENTFVGEHPTWQFDGTLTWFLQMPVYVRQLSPHQQSASASPV
ncbi:hypothetical protein JZ785_00475 [Alicyclobacillus curvatus]|nr:hypothetical protein JZ785_00475 [Alicyclobacillus curvatus]